MKPDYSPIIRTLVEKYEMTPGEAELALRQLIGMKGMDTPFKTLR